MYVSPEDRAEIYEIAIICDQWNILQGFTGDDYMMLLMACHANHKIDLARLKLASHEVMVKEIENFNQAINVDTLKLEGNISLEFLRRPLLTVLSPDARSA